MKLETVEALDMAGGAPAVVIPATNDLDEVAVPFAAMPNDEP